MRYKLEQQKKIKQYFFVIFIEMIDELKSQSVAKTVSQLLKQSVDW